MLDNTTESVPTPVDPIAEGLEKLLRMKPLDGFDFDRWAQIRRDCTKLIKDHGSVIREYGWTVLDVFGYMPKAPSEPFGLGLDIRGGTITRIAPRHVLIWRPKAGSSKWSIFRGRSRAKHIVPIWEGVAVDGPVWHRPRKQSSDVSAPAQSGLSTSEVVKVPMLFMPEHVFIAFTGPSCAIH